MIIFVFINNSNPISMIFIMDEIYDLNFIIMVPYYNEPLDHQLKHLFLNARNNDNHLPTPVLLYEENVVYNIMIS